MTRALMPLFSTLLCGWVAVQALNAIAGTLTDHQQRQSAALCQLDSSYCANR